MVGTSRELLVRAELGWPNVLGEPEPPSFVGLRSPASSSPREGGEPGRRKSSSGHNRSASRFREFWATRDPRLRAELILEHHGLAQSIARRFAWPGLTHDDLLQIARIGLIHAVDRYDPDRGATFATFATHTIVGELKRYLRDHGWPVKVPRHLRELHQQVRRANDALTRRLRRPPALDEVAEYLELAPDAVAEILELGQVTSLISLDTPVPWEDAGEQARLSDQLGACDEHLVDLETRLSVRSSVDLLEERQREVVCLRYFEGLTQSEVARRLCLSQMHISRLERRALTRLRGMLEGL